MPCSGYAKMHRIARPIQKTFPGGGIGGVSCWLHSLSCLLIRFHVLCRIRPGSLCATIGTELSTKFMFYFFGKTYFPSCRRKRCGPLCHRLLSNEAAESRINQG